MAPGERQFATLRNSCLICASALVGILLVTACSVGVQPPMSSPAISTNVAQSGYLESRASIGPLQPVDRVGVPTPTPPPAACTSRGLVVHSVDGSAEVQRIAFEPDCTYRVELPPGSYRVELDGRGIDSSRDLPRAVTILPGQTTRLDVSIDTGIR